MLCSLVEAIRECGIPFTVRIGKASKKRKVEFSSLLGEDRKKLLATCLPTKLSYCQPEMFSSKVVDLWKVIRCT